MPINEAPRKSLEQVVHECGRYPLEAFEFVRQGLNHTVTLLHGERKAQGTDDQAYHVTGQQLCRGLRDYAVLRYGLLASAILHHWGINRTNDFGRIVFTMIDSKLMAKTDDDDIRDFNNVYDFPSAFTPPARPIIPAKSVFQL